MKSWVLFNNTKYPEVFLGKGIIPRKDRFRDKAKETNESLLAICARRSIPFINYGNIDTRIHINRRGLHLTTRGSKIVGGNTVKFTKNLLFTK